MRTTSRPHCRTREKNQHKKLYGKHSCLHYTTVDVCILPINDFRLIELVTDIGGFGKLGLDYRFYIMLIVVVEHVIVLVVGGCEFKEYDGGNDWSKIGVQSKPTLRCNIDFIFFKRISCWFSIESNSLI